VGAERDWLEGENGEGRYRSRYSFDAGSSGPSSIRHLTLASAVDVTPEVLSARDLEEKLVYAARAGIFMALTVEPTRVRRAEMELLQRFPRQTVSLERLLLKAMREEAATRGAKWPVVVAADAGAPDGKEFRRLVGLAARAAETARRQVRELTGPALLMNAGLFARYDLMPILTELAQASGAREGPASLWLLVPQPDNGPPRIDGVVLPVIGSANWVRLTKPWLDNAHRAGARPAA